MRRAVVPMLPDPMLPSGASDSDDYFDLPSIERRFTMRNKPDDFYVVDAKGGLVTSEPHTEQKAYDLKSFFTSNWTDDRSLLPLKVVRRAKLSTHASAEIDRLEAEYQRVLAGMKGLPMTSAPLRSLTENQIDKDAA